MVSEPIVSSDQIVETAAGLAADERPFRVVIAAAEDLAVLRAASEAREAGIAEFTLYGSESKLQEIIDRGGLERSGFIVVDCSTAIQAAYRAAQAADQGKADVIMKGFISTSTLLKTMLLPDFSLRGKKILSHVAVLDIPGYHKLLGITDGGMVVKPNFEQKLQLIENAVTLFRCLGYKTPKVAISAPVDYIHEQIPATTDAARLTSMAKKGEIGNCEVFGPVTFDAATSREVAESRGIKNYVAGDADFILVDSIEECNLVSKVMILFSPATFAGVIVGAGVPVSLVSRTDAAGSKLASISIACLLSHYLKGGGK